MARPRINKTRYLILGLLSEGPLSGYEIRRLTQLRFRHFWSESFGQIYPELARLERDGQIVRIAARPRGARQRNEYRIAGPGTRALEDWLAESVEPETARLEILLKVYFSSLGEQSLLVRHVTDFRSRYRDALNELEGFRAQLLDAPDPAGNHERIQISIDLGLRTFRAWVEWADAILMKVPPTR